MSIERTTAGGRHSISPLSSKSWKSQECSSKSGAEVDSKDESGNTPLWRAVSDYRGDGRLIVLLRQKAADASVQNEMGISPVALARRISNYDVAKFFGDLDN